MLGRGEGSGEMAGVLVALLLRLPLPLSPPPRRLPPLGPLPSVRGHHTSADASCGKAAAASPTSPASPATDPAADDPIEPPTRRRRFSSRYWFASAATRPASSGNTDA